MIIWRDWPLTNDHLSPPYPNHPFQDPDSISWTFLEQFALVLFRGQDSNLSFLQKSCSPEWHSKIRPNQKFKTRKYSLPFNRKHENEQIFFCNFRISFNHAFQGNKSCVFFMEIKIDSFCMKLYNTCFEIVSPVSFAFDQA